MWLDRRRVNIVKAGGVEAMLKLCAESTNEKTRTEAAKAVANLASCGETPHVELGFGV